MIMDILIIVILLIILKIYEYSKNHFSQTQITTNQCISYITEEITAMGHIETNNIFELTPEHILESEFRMSKAVTSRKIDSISSELENVASEKNNTIETANSKEIEDEEEINDIKEVSNDIKTETIYSKYKNTYNFELNGVKIKNETNYDLTGMNLKADVNINNKNNGNTDANTILNGSLTISLIFLFAKLIILFIFTSSY